MKRIYLFLVGLLVLSVTPVMAADTSSSAYINGGYYNNIISDGDFTDINSMSIDDIQNFLTSKGSHLASISPDRLGTGNEGRSAAKIIYDAAHGYREASGSLNGISVSGASVSPKVLLVTLQKEQSLITGSFSDDDLNSRLRKAMGYGCPDAGGCDERRSGFTNQVEWAAWQLRYNYEAAGKDASWWTTNYPSQNHYRLNNVLSLGWAGTYYQVTINNKATGALYRYTPHVGYGNYNFWKLIIDWFGLGPFSTTSNPEYNNDLVTIETATYKTVIKVTGAKDSSSLAYFNGNLIASSGTTSWSVEIRPNVGAQDNYITYKNSSGATVGTKLIRIDRRKVGDVNGDTKVDLLDVSLMSDAWGKTVQDDASLNLNPESDNIVDLLDISLLAEGFEG